jgi:excinuclease UvrABC nuclease subunit
MRTAADDLDFELAAQIRDQIMDLKASKQTPRRQDAKFARPARGKRARR